MRTKFLGDTELNVKPEIVRTDDAFPATTHDTIKGDPIESGNIWCKKSDKSPTEINLSYRLLTLVLPSKTKAATYVLADIICALTKATETSDCDSVVSLVIKAAAVAGQASIHLAPDNWSMDVEKRDDDLHFEFSPGPLTDISPPELSPSK